MENTRFQSSFHMLIGYNPAMFLGMVVECLWEGADIAVREPLSGTVGVFALGVIVQQQHPKPGAVASGCVLQHFLVARRIALNAA